MSTSDYEQVRKVKEGDLVWYHPIIGEPARKGPFTVRAVGDIPSQKNVVWLFGKSGCVAMASLEAAT